MCYVNMSAAAAGVDDELVVSIGNIIEMIT